MNVEFDKVERHVEMGTKSEIFAKAASSSIFSKKKTPESGENCSNIFNLTF
jgi:hypothetical protein